MYLTYSSVPYRMVYPTNKTKTMMSITDCMKLICSIEYAILTVDSLECICIYIYIYIWLHMASGRVATAALLFYDFCQSNYLRS